VCLKFDMIVVVLVEVISMSVRVVFVRYIIGARTRRKMGGGGTWRDFRLLTSDDSCGSGEETNPCKMVTLLIAISEVRNASSRSGEL
jgi:hypothetical protein